MDEFDDETESEITVIQPIRARPIDYLTAFFILLDNLAEAVEDFTEMLVTITARHANYKNEQRKFADSVRGELENLPQTGQE